MWTREQWMNERSETEAFWTFAGSTDTTTVCSIVCFISGIVHACVHSEKTWKLSSLPLCSVFKVLWCLEQREHSDLLLRTLFRGGRAPLPSCIRWTHGHHDIHGPWERRKQTASGHVRSKIMCTDLFMSLFVQRLARPLLTGLKCCWCLLLTSPDKHTHVHTHTQSKHTHTETLCLWGARSHWLTWSHFSYGVNPIMDDARGS